MIHTKPVCQGHSGNFRDCTRFKLSRVLSQKWPTRNQTLFISLTKYLTIFTRYHLYINTNKTYVLLLEHWYNTSVPAFQLNSHIHNLPGFHSTTLCIISKHPLCCNWWYMCRHRFEKPWLGLNNLVAQGQNQGYNILPSQEFWQTLQMVIGTKVFRYLVIQKNGKPFYQRY